ncbi:MAG TPA: hypothetical protein VG737_01585, partial [Cyclobacteriaceae bacterium]|nr:hypothetical protein [Cyclobacteriaceae bacterium]
MKEVRTILIGLGTVNVGLLKILSDKENEIAETSGLTFSIVAVADSTGVAINTAGFDYDELISLKAEKKKVNHLAGYR